MPAAPTLCTTLETKRWRLSLNGSAIRPASASSGKASPEQFKSPKQISRTKDVFDYEPF